MVNLCIQFMQGTRPIYWLILNISCLESAYFAMLYRIRCMNAFDMLCWRFAVYNLSTNGELIYGIRICVWNIYVHILLYISYRETWRTLIGNWMGWSIIRYLSNNVESRFQNPFVHPSTHIHPSIQPSIYHSGDPWPLGRLIAIDVVRMCKRV